MGAKVGFVPGPQALPTINSPQNRMSPNAYVTFDTTRRLLVGYPGDHENEEPVFIWTYSVFEEYNGEAVSPSMYHYCVNYIDENITKTQLYELQGEDYAVGDLEEEAVDSYWNLPINERIHLHNQMVLRLQRDKARAEASELAYRTALLDHPWDATSPISQEYDDWVRSGHEKWISIFEKIEEELNEEHAWRSGAEAGASRCGSPIYDYMDEI